MPSPTPHLDALAAEALLFEQAVTPVPLTLPAHCSMLTGTTPLRHGVHDNMTYRLGEDRVTLAELLRDRGYATGAVLGAFVLDTQFGLAQGFEAYDDRIDAGPGQGVLIESQRRADEVTRRACAWVDGHAGAPFFLFAHYYDAHQPYAPPEPFATGFAGQPYAGEIAYADAEIGRLLQYLRERGLYEKSLIIVTGDHGEGLGDHGETFHGYFVYQSTLHVPLIIKPPRGGAGRRIGGRVGLVDIVPTVLGYLGMPPLEGVDGRDLREEGKDPAAAGAREYYCESLTPTTYGCTPLLGLVGSDWKLIDASSPELFQLSEDLAEAFDRAGEMPARVEEMRTRLGERVALRQAGSPGDDRQAMDEETRARLQSLGYIADRAVSEDFRPDRTRPHPRALLAYHQALETTLERLGRGDFAGARASCERMLAEHPEIPDPWILLGDIDHQLGDGLGAAQKYRRYLDQVSSGGTGSGASGAGDGEAAGAGLSNRCRAQYNLANELAALGRGPEAEQHYAEALRLNPDHLNACINLALLRAEAGRIDEAIPLFRRAVALRPAQWETRRDLAQALILRGAVDEALRLYEEGLDLQPEQGEILLARGELLLRAGRPAEALESFQRAMRMNPGDPRGHIQFARLQLALGRAREGLDAYRRGMEQAPQWHDLARELAWVLATHQDPAVRNGTEAVAICMRLRQSLGDGDISVMELLAASYAEQGRLAEAVQLEQAAVALARRAGSPRLAQMESRLKTYQAGRPLRNNFAQTFQAG